MAKYSLTKKAVEDLADIWNDTFDTWSEKQADKYYSLLLNFCKTLSQKPQLGKNYDEINKDLLGHKANHHIIFYRIIQANEIEIVRILHERMDLKNRTEE